MHVHVKKNINDEYYTRLYFGAWYRRSPYFNATLRAGCKSYDIYNHQYLPGYYDDPIKEYWHILEHVSLWDVGVERTVEISGPDASKMANLLTCRDLTKCAVGQGKYVLITGEDGGIINDPVLLRIEENKWWLQLADSDAGLWVMGVAVNSGLNVKIDEPEVYPVQIQGPKSQKVLQKLCGDEILNVRYYWTLTTNLEGNIPVVISRTGWTGEVGYEITLRDASKGDQLWNLIMEAGKEFNIRPTPPCEIRRVEAGIFNWGQDMTFRDNPYQMMGLERLVEDQEADYIGKKALEKIKKEGVKRKLVGLIVDGDELKSQLREFWPIVEDGKQIGHVTNAIWSPRLEKNIGYVWVPIEKADPGNKLNISSEQYGNMTGTTAALPFHDPKKKVPLGK